MALNPITMTPLPGNQTGGIFPGIDVGDLFLGIVFPFLFSISEFSWRIFWVFYANVCKCMPIGGRAWSVDSISWRWYGKIIISIGKWWSIEAADCISNSMPTDANGCKWARADDLGPSHAMDKSHRWENWLTEISSRTGHFSTHISLELIAIKFMLMTAETVARVELHYSFQTPISPNNYQVT